MPTRSVSPTSTLRDSRGVPRWGEIPVRSTVSAAVLVSACLWAVFIYPASSPFFLSILLFWVLRGPYPALQALFLSTGIAYVNIAHGSQPSAAAVLKWVILVVAAVKYLIWPAVARRGKRYSGRWLWWLLAFAGAVATGAYFTSLDGRLSFFKLVAITTGVGAALTIANGALAEAGQTRVRWWCNTFFTSILLASMPLLGRSEGVFRNGIHFQGLLSHPMAFGFFMAMGGALALTGLVWGATRWLWLLVLVAYTGALVQSGSRTAILSFAIAALVSSARWTKPRSARPKGRLIGQQTTAALVMALLLLGVVSAVFSASARNAVARVLVKWPSVFDTTDSPWEVTAQSVSQTRGTRLLTLLDLTGKSPIVGLGLGTGCGVYSYDEGRTQWGEIPLSAPVEWGNLWAGLLCETGWLGVSLFTGLLVSVAWPALRGGGPFLAAVVVVLASNLTEGSLASFGGVASLEWILLGVSGGTKAGLDLKRAPFLRRRAHGALLKVGQTEPANAAWQ